MITSYTIAEVVPYINWVYFFHAWGMSQQPEQEKARLRAEAEERLHRFAHHYHTHALFRLLPAYSDGDDIIALNAAAPAAAPAAPAPASFLIPCLRQQQRGSDFLSLADFLAPTPPTHHIGVFATTVDAQLETDFSHDPYEKMMMQLLADRLAEATAERLHEQVRKHLWGYAPDEHLTIAEMLQERWQGIRPAVGYPSLPDTSLNFVIDQILNLRQIGIRLTESGAMKPHASVSGLMLNNPHARYFSVGKIGDDQLRDYARRRGLPIELVRQFLAANL